ncbi:MAG: hypothetical protein KKH98_02485, partial [Spirochaetes bacterium]|nr:hypothetical protein [Spirochaetota bacterium]
LLIILINTFIIARQGYTEEKEDTLFSGSKTNARSKEIKNFILSGELGGGQMISLGFGFNIGDKLFPGSPKQYVRSFGIILGFTPLEEAAVFEPALFLDGMLVRNIRISGKRSLDIKWRVKFGYNFVESKEYDISAKAYSFGPDFLFKMSHFYIILSTPLVFGEEETELAPCIGTGVEFEI